MEQEEACGDDSSETSEDCVLCLCLRLCIIVCMVRDLLLPPFSQGDLLHFKQQAWCFFFLQVLWGIMFFFQVLWGTFYIRLHGVLFNLPTPGLVKWTCYATDFKGNTNLTTKGATLSFSYVARCFHFRFFWLAGLKRAGRLATIGECFHNSIDSCSTQGPGTTSQMEYLTIGLYIYIDNICMYRLMQDSVALSFRIFVLTIVIPCQD